MKDELLRKLRAELSQPITTERQVVYILVQVRKLMDRQAKDARDAGETKAPGYAALRLYCNWVAHINLSNTHAQDIVRMANDLYPKIVQETLSADEKTAFREQYAFASLRRETDDLIAAHHLPPFSDQNWNSFVSLLLLVLQDCPLLCKSTEHPLAEVDEVVLRSEPSQGGNTPDGTPPRIVWGLFRQGQVRHWVTQN